MKWDIIHKENLLNVTRNHGDPVSGRTCEGNNVLHLDEGEREHGRTYRVGGGGGVIPRLCYFRNSLVVQTDPSTLEERRSLQTYQRKERDVETRPGA